MPSGALLTAAGAALLRVKCSLSTCECSHLPAAGPSVASVAAVATCCQHSWVNSVLWLESPAWLQTWDSPGSNQEVGRLIAVWTL